MSNKVNKLLAIVLCLVMTVGSVAAVAEPAAPESSPQMPPAEPAANASEETLSSSEADGAAAVEDSVADETEKPAFSESLKAMENAALLAKLNELLAPSGIVLTEEQVAELKTAEDFTLGFKNLIMSLLPEGLQLSEAAFTALMSEKDETAFGALLLAALAPAPAENKPSCTCPGTEEEKAAEGFEHKPLCPLCTLPLYERLMACESLEDLFTVAAAAAPEDVAALTEEQMNEIDAREAQLRALANPAVPQSEAPETTAPPAGDSETATPAVDYLYVAPLMPPVEGVAPFMAFSMFAMDNPATEPEPDNGIVLDKTAEYDPASDMVHIILEAYATGSQITTDTSEEVPTDIVLVLDQSGSMDWDMKASGGYARYTGSDRKNSNLYNKKDNLWFKTEDGKYIRVSVTKERVYEGQTTEYKEVPAENRHNADNWYGGLGNGYWDIQDMGLYAKIGGEYKRVSVTYTGSSNSKYIYSYKLSDGTVIATSRKNEGQPDFSRTTDSPMLYTKHTSGGNMVNKYTYSYTTGGKEVIIGSSTGDSTEFTPNLYYVESKGTVKRINALKTALGLFTSSVTQKANGPDGVAGTADDVNHRIAVVGFASGKDSSSEYKNSELKIGANDYNYRYLNLSESTGSKYSKYFGSAFQDMNSTDGQANVSASISSLQAEGATNTHYGMEMAQKILQENPVPAGEKRNRVVIVFTDGAPTTSNGFKINVADKAIDYANAIKGEGTTVYGVGIFSGADGTSAGNRPKGNLDSDEFKEGEETQTGKDACNWFMQNLSSNNGTPLTPSYYLSASNQTGLDTIFESIAGQIQSGGSKSTLTADAVIRDAVAPQFVLPQNAEIKVSTVDSQGIDENGQPIWNTATKAPLAGAVAVNDGKNNISVKGFDYSNNWVGKDNNNGTITTHNGKKLVIEFNVKREDHFLGGDHVYTNGDGNYASGGQGAYIYENEASAEALEAFPKPDVEVTMNSTIGKAEETIYLGEAAHLDALADNVMYDRDGNLFVSRKTVDGRYVDCVLDGKNNSYADVIYNVYAEGDTEHSGKPVASVTVPAGTDMSIPANRELYKLKWTDPDMPHTTALTAGDHSFPVTVTLRPHYYDETQQKPVESDPDGELIVHVLVGNIHLRKVVDGSLGDINQPFTFTVTAGGKSLSMIGTDGKPILDPATGQPADIILRHGDDRLVGTVSSGDVLIFTEECLDYTATAEVELQKTGAEPVKKILSVKTENGKAEFTYTLPNMGEYDSVTVTVTNTREGTPDTGVVLDSLPYILILVIVAAAVVVVIVKKKHRKEDE